MKETKRDGKIRRALSSVDGKTWEQGGRDAGGKALPRESAWPTSQEDRESVVKMVVGKLVKEGAEGSWDELIDVFQEDVGGYFPNLQYLHVWGLGELTKIKALPQLVELDLQSCHNLTSIDKWESQEIQVLVLKNCGQLASLPTSGKCNKLEELELIGGRSISEEWIQEILNGTSDLLWKLDVSGCENLRSIPRLKKGVRDLRANACSRLVSLPGHWPGGLRRLELQDTLVDRLPEWRDPMDYVNLAQTPRLRSLGKGISDKEDVFPRTLFLHGSGIRKPPAVVHGATDDENVAKLVYQYLQQIKTVGYGSIRRCKFLFLGNGQAGKTSLALSLEKEATGESEGKKTNPAEMAAELGSTHGIRLATRMVDPAEGGGVSEKIRLDHWDFGGQEIYHNAHANFVQTGSLFVLLWKREQDGQKGAICPVTGYEDLFHPLRYWLDLVRMSTGGKGKVMIVASHQTALTDTLVKACSVQRKGYLRDEAIQLYAFDAEKEEGQLAEIEQWIRDEASDLVEAEGEEVPVHWQIAEEMVTGWQTSEEGEKINELDFEAFHQDLRDEISRRIEKDDTDEFVKLREALDRDEFKIDEGITRQVLQVLANLGVLYWSPRLFNERVIIAQDWALKGIYAVLDRRKEEDSIYKELVARKGRFTRKLLHEQVWGKSKDFAETGVQELLLSLMQDCQICFRLREEKWDGYRWREDEYVSLKHLPKAVDLRLEGRVGMEGPFFRGELGAREADLSNPHMCEHHWHAILVRLGREYGEAAEYASDGFYLPKNEDGQSVLIRVVIRPGRHEESDVYIDVVGPKAEELKGTTKNSLIELLPDRETGRMKLVPPGQLRLAGNLDKKVTLFISYAHNNNPTESADRFDYEGPVNRICERFEGVEENIEILIDRSGIVDVSPDEREEGTFSVVEFMREAAKADHVLVVHSGKYWMSQYCMYEAWKCNKAVGGLGQKEDQKFLFLDLGRAAGKAGVSQPSFEEVCDRWNRFAGGGELSLGLRGDKNGTTVKKLGRGAENFFDDVFAEMADNSGQRMTWEGENLDDIVEWIVRRCGFEVDAE